MADRIVNLANAGEILEVDPGDRIIVDWQTTYVGPAFRETVQVDIYEGIWGVNDDAKTYGKAGVDLPKSLEPVAYAGTPITTGPIPDNCAGLTLGLYIKIGNVMPVKGVGAFDNVIQVSGATSPEFSDLMITSYSKI